MANCPTCNKEVDPLRAPSARVIGGRVVAFCSAACANAAAEAGASAAKARIADATEKPERSEKRAAKPASMLDELEASRSRSVKTTNPIDAGDVVEEHAVPRRARTEPPRPPPRSGSGTHVATSVDAGDDDAVPDVRPRRRRGLVLMFAAIIVVGGMAIAIVQTVSPSTPERAGATPDSPSVTDAAPAADAVPAKIDHAAAARAALTELIHGDSDRVRRVAAAALARTGDKDAVETLAELLAAETSDITKLDIAYALGRAGDKRGIDVLVAATRSNRRDVKADGARNLVLLGDPGGAGAKVLATFLELRTMRLGAAEPLARIGDAKAIAALEAIHADQSLPADDRTRAAIALARAKRPEVVTEVRALLSDGRFNAFAAAALAEQGDASGKEVLIKQLGVPSLRVEAAVALRRLEPNLDAEPLLPALVIALGENKDVARVAVAEAILVLTGPAAWAEHD
jgi:HEAT repeat protein